MKQKTIKSAITSKGIGLHSGKEVILSFLPAPVNHGVVFQRTDMTNQPFVPAIGELVHDTMMSSNLTKDGASVGTVEHLLSAIAGLEIDNLIVQVSAAEMPIMDGSAAEFVKLLLKAGIEEQTTNKKYLRIKKLVRVEEADKWAQFTPLDGYELHFEIDFNHPAINKTGQKASLVMTPENYINQLSQARTFGFLKDIELLKQNNLALGGNLDNAIVLTDDEIMNKEGLRFDDEFVRHKILDAVGDLFLIGYPLKAKFEAYKSGHGLNNKLVRAVLADPDNYEIIE